VTPTEALLETTSPAASPARASDASLIRSLTPRGGEAVEVGLITVFMGPHNCGKTETLRDILRLTANFDLSETPRASEIEPQPIVLSDLAFVPKLSVERMLLGLAVLEVDASGSTVVQGLAPNLKTPLRRTVSKELKSLLYRPILTARTMWNSPLGQLMALRMAYINPAMHRRLIEPTPACGPTDGPEHLLQVLQDAAPAVHQALAAAFGEAFEGVHLKLDTSERVRLTLRVSPTPFSADSPDPIANARQNQQLRGLHEMGDAWQSYAAVVLSILLGEGRVILLDQPEAFLRPDQARRLGRWIGQQVLARSCQVFVVTSSSDFLQGLAEAPYDLTIIRLSRRDNITRFQAVPSAPAKALARVPLFACPNALRLLLCDGVIVVPEDRDQIVYETVARQTAPAENLGFLAAVGARNLAFAAGALRQAGMPVGVITELDLLRSEKEFVELVKAVTGSPPPQPWLATRERLARHVEGTFNDQALADHTEQVESFLEQTNGARTATDKPAVEVNGGRTTEHWDRVRDQRLELLPRELRIWVEELIEDLKRKGIFVSPQGRLEGWLDFDVRDRTLWLNHAMQALHRGQFPAALRGFVGEVVAYLRSSSLPARMARSSHGAGTASTG